jgi:hypothetical protein
MADFATLSPYGTPKIDPAGGVYRMRTSTTLKAVEVSSSLDGLRVGLDDGSQWKYVAASTATDATEQLVLTPASAPTAGRWCRYDRLLDLEFAIGFATTDAQVLFTVPSGFSVRLNPGAYWDVTTAFTGGTSSAIGLSSNTAPYSTKGDILGGAAGDLAAGLTAGAKRGNAGADFGSGGQIVLPAAATIRFDRITSVFDAGDGKAVLPCRLVLVP